MTGKLLTIAGLSAALMAALAAEQPGELFPGRGEPAASQPSEVDPQITQIPQTPVSRPDAEPLKTPPASQPAVYNGVAELIRAMPEEWLTSPPDAATVKSRFAGATLIVKPSKCDLGSRITYRSSAEHPKAAGKRILVTVSLDPKRTLSKQVRPATNAIVGFRGTITSVSLYADTLTTLRISCAAEHLTTSPR